MNNYEIVKKDKSKYKELISDLIKWQSLGCHNGIIDINAIKIAY